MCCGEILVMYVYVLGVLTAFSYAWMGDFQIREHFFLIALNRFLCHQIPFHYKSLLPNSFLFVYFSLSHITEFLEAVVTGFLFSLLMSKHSSSSVSYAWYSFLFLCLIHFLMFGLVCWWGFPLFLFVCLFEWSILFPTFLSFFGPKSHFIFCWIWHRGFRLPLVCCRLSQWHLEFISLFLSLTHFLFEILNHFY